MWRLWLFFGIFKISSAAPASSPAHEILSSTDLSALQCLMITSPLGSCDVSKRSKYTIPRRLQKLYAGLKQPFLNVATKEIFNPSQMENIPPTLLYFIPKIRLSAMSGTSASNIIRNYPFDDALTLKITGLLTDDEKWEEFLSGLAGSAVSVLDDYGFHSEQETSRDAALLSPLVETEVSSAMARSYPNGSLWNSARFEGAMSVGSPLLASLPSHFLHSLSAKSVEKFLFHLRNWQGEVDPPLSDTSLSITVLWSHHTRPVQRMWAYLALERSQAPSEWTPRLLRHWFFLLPGATADQLSSLPRDLRLSSAYPLLLQQPWSRMQARAVFDVLFSDREVGGDLLLEVRDLIGQLLPRQLRQLNSNNTAVSFIPKASISLPTNKQLMELQLSSSVGSHVMPGLAPGSWNHSVAHLGWLVHTLPASSLSVFANLSLPQQTLARMDSPSLSFRQARYLAGTKVQDNNPMLLKNLLKAVSASSVVALHSNLVAQATKQHLLTFVPAANPVLSATVMDKIRNDLGEKQYLESLLSNKDHHTLLSYVSSQDIASKFRDISSSLHIIVQTNPRLEKTVRLLPTRILSQLLALHRHEVLATDGSWTWDNLMMSATSPAVRYYVAGLTCADVESLDTADVVPVLGYYVREKRALNQAFPKNMQYCCQKALAKYLQLKASIRGIDHEAVGLMNLLESHEVKAVGGFILASLPMELIVSSHLLHQIVGEIGKLTLPELLLALRPSSIRFLAQTQTHLDLKGLTHLGNLVWFLDEDHTKKIVINDFRLFLESLEDTASRALCLDRQGRSNWRRLLIQTFGKTDSWSAGVVQLLGDLLFVLDEYDLSRINKTSWSESADVSSKYSSLHQPTEWAGKTKMVPFYQVCLEILPVDEDDSYLTAVKVLVRYQLEAAQMLLDTVVTAEHLLRFSEQPNLVEPVESINGSSAVHITTTTTSAATILSTSTTVPTSTVNLPVPSPSTTTVQPSSSLPPEIIQNDQPLDHDNGLKESEEKDWLYDYDDSITVDKEMRKKERWRREIGDHEGKTRTAQDKDAKIFRSKDDKTVEERREEIRKNATRDLVVEKLEDVGVVSSAAGAPRVRDIKISCDAVRIVGGSSSLVLDSQDVDYWTDTELEDCTEVLGELELEPSLRTSILSRLNVWRESGNLLEIGSLVTVLEEHDLGNVSLELSKPWALENLALISSQVTDLEMLTSVADSLLLELHDPSPAVVASLGRLVCSFPQAHRRRFLLEWSDGAPLRHVAGRLARSIPCDNDEFRACLADIAVLVTDDEAYGETSSWDAHDVADLDVIVAGLAHPEWHGSAEKGGLRPEALAGLSPAAVACIPPLTFKDLTEEQLSWLPALSVAAISPAQSSSLSPAQSEVLDRVRRQVPEAHLRGTRSSASQSVPFSSALGVTVVALFVAVRTLLTV